jgi:Glycosyl transferases group 1
VPVVAREAGAMPETLGGAGIVVDAADLPLYQRHRAPEASLVLIGSDRGFENYRRALEALVVRVGARRVFFTGPISSAARDAWYRYADVYLSMSVHEGFCAPLIEALGHGLPVVARAAGAVPETVGEAGWYSTAPIRPWWRKRSTRPPLPSRRETRCSMPLRTASRNCGRTCSRRASARPLVLCPKAVRAPGL